MFPENHGREDYRDLSVDLKCLICCSLGYMKPFLIGMFDQIIIPSKIVKIYVQKVVKKN